MLLSLITGTRNRPEGLRRLIRSVEQHTDVLWQMAVADASDIPPTEDFGPRVTIIREEPRLGFARGYNQAIRSTTGKYVLWLNDDCEVTPGYAKAAINFLDSHQQIGLGALYYSENGAPFRVNRSWGIPYANFGILSRSLGDQIGWFDESLRMYGADNALTFRVLLARRGVAGIPEARILHHSEDDSERIQNQMNRDVDADLLRKKYLPRLRAMRPILQKHRRLAGLEVLPR